jgi:non-ribosomal peptide synthetase component F
MRKSFVMMVLAFSILGVLKVQRTLGARANQDEQIQKEVLKLENERDRALMNNDADWFERVFADDMDYNSGTVTKAQIVAEIRSKERKWQAVRHDDYRVRVYGNTAVVTYTSGSTMEYKGKVSTNRANTTDVYVKQAGVWRAVVHDVIPIAKQ